MSRKIFDWLMNSRFYPHIYFSRSPFKIYEFIEMIRGVDVRPDDVILDIGCGAGLQTNLFGRRAKKIIGIDIDPNPVGRALSEQHLVAGRINSEFRCTTVEDAGFADDMFDKIFSVCVIEHIPDHRSVLKTAHRILKPGGRFIFTADCLATIDDEELKRRHTTAYHVQRYFTAEGLRSDLEAAGFKDITIEPVFRSNYARDLFKQAIRNDFIFRYSESVIQSWLLRMADVLTSRKDKGIFLHIRCSK